MNVAVTILDMETRRMAYVAHYPAEYWMNGSGKCDCNRESAFFHHTERLECIGCKRFLIIAVDPIPSDKTLVDFNSGYPPELILDKAIEVLEEPEMRDHDPDPPLGEPYE